jgi:hypothetical protein
LGAIVKRLGEFEDVIDTRGLPEEGNPLLVKSLWLLLHILLLRKVEEITVLGDRFSLTLVLPKSVVGAYLEHLGVEDGGDSVDDQFDVGLVDGRVYVHGAERRVLPVFGFYHLLVT